MLLRKYHLDDGDYVTVQCTRETTKEKLYEGILKEAGVHCDVASSKTITGGWKLNAKLGGRGEGSVLRR